MADEAEPIRTCEAHGLRFDARIHDGCVVCRRGQPSAAPPAASSSETPRVLYVLGGVIVVLVAIAGLVALVLGLDDPPATPVVVDHTPSPLPEPEVDPAVAATDPDELLTYLEAVRTEYRRLPLAEAHETTEGIIEDTETGRYDETDRQVRLASARFEVGQGRLRMSRLEPPPAAAEYHQQLLDYLDGMARQLALGERMLAGHQRTIELVARRDGVRTREDAIGQRELEVRHAAELRQLLRDVGDAVEDTRAARLYLEAADARFERQYDFELSEID